MLVLVLRTSVRCGLWMLVLRRRRHRMFMLWRRVRPLRELQRHRLRRGWSRRDEQDDERGGAKPQDGRRTHEATRSRGYPEYQISAVRNRSALPITDTELKLMAAAAIMGESRIPNTGYSTPAAMGTPAELYRKAKNRFCLMLFMVA